MVYKTEFNNNAPLSNVPPLEGYTITVSLTGAILPSNGTSNSSIYDIVDDDRLARLKRLALDCAEEMNVNPKATLSQQLVGSIASLYMLAQNKYKGLVVPKWLMGTNGQMRMRALDRLNSARMVNRMLDDFCLEGDRVEEPPASPAGRALHDIAALRANP
jgi:hypothetical protein